MADCDVPHASPWTCSTGEPTTPMYITDAYTLNARTPPWLIVPAGSAATSNLPRANYQDWATHA
eukprot:7922016-Alexandrium_andersonii.AAC.1